jgi:hypothetical protein
MIPIEKLKQVTTVYTHSHCPDGLASAMILKDAFSMLGMSPRIEFLTHGTPEHKNAGIEDGCPIFCDIAPSDYARQYVAAHGGLVLDHHVGAKALVESFGENGVYADADKEPGVSGAVLAWREVWQPVNREIGNHDFLMGAVPIAVQAFAAHIGARDTWQPSWPSFQRGQWTSKALMSKPASYWLDQHPPYLLDHEVLAGQALFEAHEDAVKQAVEQCVHYDVPDGDRLVELYVFQEQACGFRLCSDTAEALRPNHSTETARAIVAGFAYVVDKPGGKPRLIYSLRGLGGFDVCTFAKANGGGGHKAAAGFSADPASVTDPYALVRDRLAMFLVACQ